MSSYEVTVGGATVLAKSFREATSIVAEAVTGFVASEPEAVAQDALMINQAFGSGAAEHSLTAHGRWSTTVTVHGDPVEIAIIKRR